MAYTTNNKSCFTFKLHLQHGLVPALLLISSIPGPRLKEQPHPRVPRMCHSFFFFLNGFQLFVSVLILNIYFWLHLSYSTWDLLLQLRDSCCGLQAYGLGCSVAGRVSAPQPGIKPTPAALQGGFFTTGPPQEVPGCATLKSKATNGDETTKLLLSSITFPFHSSLTGQSRVHS